MSQKQSARNWTVEVGPRVFARLKDKRKQLVALRDAAECREGDLLIVSMLPGGTKPRRIARMPIAEVCHDGANTVVRTEGRVHVGARILVRPLLVSVAIAFIFGFVGLCWRCDVGEPPKVLEPESTIDVRAAAGGGGELWRVCIYDGVMWRKGLLPSWLGKMQLWLRKRQLRLPGMPDTLGAGGDEARLVAAREGVFTHRINAGSPAKAKALLHELRQRARREGARIALVAILDHGGPGRQTFGEGTVVNDALFDECGAALRWKGAEGLILLGCEVAQGSTGLDYLRMIARAYGCPVFGSREQVLSDDGDPDETKKGLVTAYNDIWKADPSRPGVVRRLTDEEAKELLPW